METYTAEEFNKFLGLKSKKLGILAKLYTDFSIVNLTDSLWNIYAKDAKPSKAESIESRSFDWQVETSFIKLIEFAADPDGDGSDGTDITFYFKERYYERFDIFRIEESRQQCIVTQRPIRKADDFWAVTARLIDNDYSSILDATACTLGKKTRFLSVAASEMSEEGYTKTQSHIETHRNYMTYFRNDISWSSEFAAMKDVYFRIADDKTAGQEVIYKMDPLEKVLTDNFMQAKSMGLLFNKTNIDPLTGKCTTVEPDTGRPIPIGEGVVPQVERWAQKVAYNKLNPSVLTLAMSKLREKCENETGNEWVNIMAHLVMKVTNNKFI